MKETLTREKLTFEVFYPHAPERVWRALTDPAALRRWLMPTDFRPRLGRKFRFAEPANGRFQEPIHCEVVELDAPHRLAYTWQSEHDAEPTLVTWTLEPVEGGTRVHLEHAAPALASNAASHAEAELNWTMTLSNGLPAMLDRSPRWVMGRIDLPDARARMHPVGRLQTCLHRRTSFTPAERTNARTSERLNTLPCCKEKANVSYR